MGGKGLLSMAALFGVMVVAATVLAGCAGAPDSPPTIGAMRATATPVEEPPAGSAASALATPTKAPPPPLQLEGKGSQSSPSFWFRKATWFFLIKHEGQSKFALALLDDRGEQVEVVISGVGDLYEARLIGIPQDGAYSLRITADGKWRLNIRQGCDDCPIDVAAPSAYEEKSAK